MISKVEYTDEINFRRGLKTEPVKLTLLERMQQQNAEKAEEKRESVDQTPSSPVVKQPVRTAAERYRRKIDLEDSLYEPSHKVQASQELAQKSVVLSDFNHG